jgi:hypothetical protein
MYRRNVCVLARHGRVVRCRPIVTLSGKSDAPSLSGVVLWVSLQDLYKARQSGRVPNITHVSRKPRAAFRRHALSWLADDRHVYERLP